MDMTLTEHDIEHILKAIWDKDALLNGIEQKISIDEKKTINERKHKL